MGSSPIAHPILNLIRTQYQQPQVAIKSAIQHIPLFKSRDYLYRKYVVEKRSIAEIASEISSAESSVHKYLVKYGLVERKPGQTITKRRQLSYGKRMVKREEVEFKRELETVEKMRHLRSQGFSYWKIADILNAMKVPTKTKKGRWHARSVQKVLDDSDRKKSVGSID